MHRVVSRLALSSASIALLAGGLVAVGTGSAAADTAPRRPEAAAASGGSFTSLAPYRLLDTRTTGGALAPTETRSLKVVGAGGVPATGVAAVAVNLTAVTPQVAGYLSAFPGPSKPTVSNLNFRAGQTIANYAVVPVSGGQIQLYNGSVGRTDVLVDVTGWYASGSSTNEGSFTSTGPTRLLDTRNTGKPVPGLGTLKVQVGGTETVPSSAGGAVLNITAVGAGTVGYVTVYPGGTRPTVSNVSFAAGQTVAGLAATALAADGSVTLFNSSPKPLQVLVDVSGSYRGTTASQAGYTSLVTPTRISDSRSTKAPLAAQATRSIPVAGRGGVPASGVSAVIVTTTVTNTQGSGYLTVYGGGARPKASVLNFTRGATVPNLVIVPVVAGAITVFNGSGAPLDVLVDVSGFVRSSGLAVPNTSTSRYVNDLLTSDSDGAITEKMYAHGQDDAVAIDDGDDRTTLLEFGAQSNKVPNEDGGLSFGVLPPNTQDDSQRLTYAQVVTAVQGYLQGFQAGRGESATGVVTVAVGTSNDGYVFAPGATPYNPSDKGADWASDVVAPLVGYGAARDVNVVGAYDIEPNFDGTAANVRAWESAFLGGNSLKLINNGAAPACPSTLGQTGQNCQPVGSDHTGSPAQQWSQADYVSFSRSSGTNRVSVLPQIYSAVDAARWENISLTSVAAGTGPLVFAGVLTQVGACGTSCSLTPADAWVTMRQYLDSSSATAGTALPTVSDIDYDS